jgi:glycosyltransferase involved in cell wall biosynthesis
MPEATSGADESSRRKPMIIHVAESFASGTASAIGDFVRNYPDAEHHVVYAFREEALIDSRELDCFASATAMPPGTVARIRFLRRHLRDQLNAVDGQVVVHAHSSKAGGYVRAAVRKSRRLPVVYTPHCYSFERADVGLPVRTAFLVMEWLLSFNTTAYAACSPREAELSRWTMSSPRVVGVPNVTPPGLPPHESASSGRPLRIIGNGRLGPQKDPLFFAAAFEAAAAKHPDIEALWVGGGDPHLVDVLHASGVKTTGWLPRSEALKAMASGDLYLHTALWEGFPISIMEAVGIGLPVVSRRRPYLHGIEMPALIDQPEEFAVLVTQLAQENELATLRRKTEAALAGNTNVDQRAALRDLYGPLFGPR